MGLSRCYLYRNKMLTRKWLLLLCIDKMKPLSGNSTLLLLLFLLFLLLKIWHFWEWMRYKVRQEASWCVCVCVKRKEMIDASLFLEIWASFSQRPFFYLSLAPKFLTSSLLIILNVTIMSFDKWGKSWEEKPFWIHFKICILIFISEWWTFKIKI